MSFDPRSRRFDPHWLFPVTETDEEEPSGEPDASPFYWDEESTDDLVGRIIAEVLEQIAPGECRVCPLCGAIVASDGSQSS